MDFRPSLGLEARFCVLIPLKKLQQGIEKNIFGQKNRPEVVLWSTAKTGVLQILVMLNKVDEPLLGQVIDDIIVV